MQEDVVKEQRLMEKRVNDLHVACYLLAKGRRLVRVEGPYSRRGMVFLASDQDILEFYDDQTTINPRRLLDAMKNLKGMLSQPT